MLNLHKLGSTSLWGAITLMGDVINSGKHVYENKVEMCK
jgi:hypothetical protein